MSSLTFVPALRTDVGLVRRRNEDAVFASPRVVAVADGVGGHAAGEVASAAARDELSLLDKCRLDGPLGSALARAVAAANERIRFLAQCRPAYSGMATTLTAVAIEGDGYEIANIGDSRAYLLRDGELTRLTRDDSLVQELVETGAISPAEARVHPQRSVVLASLDGDPSRAATLEAAKAQPGDRVLVCSDGLSDLVDDERISDLLSLPGSQDAADALVDAALDAGGRDNVSAIVADVVTDRDGWVRSTQSG